MSTLLVACGRLRLQGDTFNKSSNGLRINVNIRDTLAFYSSFFNDVMPVFRMMRFTLLWRQAHFLVSWYPWAFVTQLRTQFLDITKLFHKLICVQKIAGVTVEFGVLSTLSLCSNFHLLNSNVIFKAELCQRTHTKPEVT